MNITAYLYETGGFISIVTDPDGSGQYATDADVELLGNSTPEEVLLSMGYEMVGGWEESSGTPNAVLVQV